MAPQPANPQVPGNPLTKGDILSFPHEGKKTTMIKHPFRAGVKAQAGIGF